MSYYNEDPCEGEYYQPSEYDEKIQEFKNLLRESVKQEILDEITNLTNSKVELSNKLNDLKNEFKEVKQQNENISVDKEIFDILVKSINKKNIESIISQLFTKTFNENTYDCPLWYGLFVNYYNDKNKILQLLRYVSIEVPKEADSLVFPHEWDKGFIDKFFDTMSNHVNCNGSTYEDNLRYFSYRNAIEPFVTSCGYDEIPWQFVLRNPLLNTMEYAEKISSAINKANNGQKFCRICDYQTLDNDVLKYIVTNVKPITTNKASVINKFLEANLDLIEDEHTLKQLYEIISDGWQAGKLIAKMPIKYQLKFAKTIKDIDDIIKFFKISQLSTTQKGEILKKFYTSEDDKKEEI